MAFNRSDLMELQDFLSRAVQVIRMDDVFDGDTDAGVIGMRHDVDDDIVSSVSFALWEHSLGYESTYYFLHTAPYWQNKNLLKMCLAEIAGLDHEIGIHNNAVTEAMRTGRDPKEILHEAIEELRGYGYKIRSTVAHGDRDCYTYDGQGNREVYVVNDEMFTECARPELGEPCRELKLGDIVTKLNPVSLSEFGLEFDANRLPRAKYISESGGHWSPGTDEIVTNFPYDGQLHMLIHPQWWKEAFDF